MGCLALPTVGAGALLGQAGRPCVPPEGAVREEQEEGQQEPLEETQPEGGVLGGPGGQVLGGEGPHAQQRLGGKGKL